MNYKSFLDNINQKTQLTEDEEFILISKLKQRTYLKGQYIIQQDDIYRYQTFVVSGKVRTFYLDNDGNEHIVAFGIENWWVGDICSFTTQTPAEFNSQCLEKTEVIQIAFEDMEDLYREVPKLERYFRITIQKAYGNMSKRIVRNHSMPAKDRYLYFLETYPEIAQRVPQYMLASYLGITKEFLSRMRKKMANDNKN
ncbi:MAG: Crp/Fnr family transcriptional regulator [Bacteroidota bacterium]